MTKKAGGKTIDDNRTVILFIDSLMSGGAQRQLVELGGALVGRGLQVRMLVYHEFDHYLSRLNELGVPLDRVEKRRRLDPVFCYKLFRYLRSHRPSSLIAYLRGPTIWARLIGKIARVPKVITSERNTDIGHSRLFILLERLTWRFSDKIVANAETIKKELVSHASVAPGRVAVIPNGIDLRRFDSLSDTDLANFRNERRIPKDKFLLLLPGRIDKQKNHRILLEALARLPKERIDNLLLLLAGKTGDQDLKMELDSFIESRNLLEKVTFLGEVRDIDSLIMLADSVILPSLWEGFPNAVLEGMAAGKVVIASDVSDNKLIIDDGRDGFIFRSEDVADLTETLNKALTLSADDKARMGQRARAKIENAFTIDKLVDRYLRIIAD